VQAFTFTTQYPKFLFPGDTQMITDNDNVPSIDSKRILSTVNPISYLKTVSEIRKFKPDVLIMKFWMSFFGPSLGFVSGQLGKDVKTIAMLDNVIPHEKRFFDTAFTKYFLKRVHAYICMSEKVQNDLLSIDPNVKVKLMPHPLYNHFGESIDKKNACNKLNIDPQKKTLLFFGFIRDYKGLDLLIDSFSNLDNSFQLIIAGESYGSFERYEKRIHQNSNRENIYPFVRYIPDSEVPLFFSAADVCILPYHSATQSGITGISYHFELPMIATNVGGLSEIIEHEQTGLIVSKPDQKLLSQTITTYFSDNRIELFKKNIKELKQKLSWENMAKDIIKFCNTL
jgi:glycosyltransferase involved in cell wall biosynthesis